MSQLRAVHSIPMDLLLTRTTLHITADQTETPRNCILQTARFGAKHSQFVPKQLKKRKKKICFVRSKLSPSAQSMHTRTNPTNRVANYII